MTLHMCPDCRTRRAQLGIHRQDLKVAARKLARSDEPKYRRAVKSAKRAVEDSKERLAEHEAECQFVAEAPKPVRGTGAERGRSQRKATVAGPTRAEKRAARVPSREELAAAIAEQPPVSLTKGRRVR